MVDSWSYNQLNLEKDTNYSIGFNEGSQFNKVTFVGTKLMNGKSMLCFVTEDLHDLSVNPSYVSFIASNGINPNYEFEQIVKEKEENLNG